MVRHPLPLGVGGAGNEPLERPPSRGGCTDPFLHTSLTRKGRVSPGADPPHGGGCTNPSLHTSPTREGRVSPAQATLRKEHQPFFCLTS